MNVAVVELGNNTTTIVIAFIALVGSICTTVGTVLVIRRQADAKAEQIQDRVQLVKVHDLVNSLSAKREEAATDLGKAEGRAEGLVQGVQMAAQITDPTPTKFSPKIPNTSEKP